MKVAKTIGFPLIIKAAFGGGGRGMRIVHKPGDLSALLDEAQGEPARLWQLRCLPREIHSASEALEVQILATSTATSSTSASATARAAPPSEGHRGRAFLRSARADRARALRRRRRSPGKSATTTPAPSNFSMISTPRVVLHRDEPAHSGRAHGHRGCHRLDLVRAQILIAQGHALQSPEVGMPAQNDVAATATPSSAASPPRIRKINSFPTTVASSPIARLAVSASASTAAWATGRCHHAVLRLAPREEHHERADLRLAMRRALRTLSSSASAASRPTFPFSKTSLRTAVPERPGDDDPDRHHAGALRLQPRRDRATKLLNFLGNVIINGNRTPRVTVPTSGSIFPRRSPTTTASPRPTARVSSCWSSVQRNLRSGH